MLHEIRDAFAFLPESGHLGKVGLAIDCWLDISVGKGSVSTP